MHLARPLLTACLSLATLSAAAQGGPDELWDMSTRMEMAGMPGQTFNMQSCMKKGQTQPDRMNQDRNCKVAEQRTVGNKTTWKIVCGGPNPVTGEGEVTRTRDTMNGRIRMTGKRGNEPFDMTTVMSGRLVGTCNAEDQQKKAQAMVAQGNAQIAQMCRDSMDRYVTQMFEGEGAACKAQKPEFCARVNKTAQSMRTPAGYRKSAKAADWEQVGKVCKVNMASVRGEACKSAVGGRDWGFVADHCPAQAKKIAAEQCAGRGYTAAMASEYKEVCARYASRGTEERPAAAAAPAAPAAPTAADVVKDGASALRKLFGR